MSKSKSGMVTRDKPWLIADTFPETVVILFPNLIFPNYIWLGNY